MKKLLSYIHWNHLKHLYHVEEKKVPHYHRLLQSFFRSRNGKLIVILILAAMIPLTVLGVQTVQNLRQEAAGPNVPKAACDGISAGLLVEPRPAIKGQKIVFKHTAALPPITQDTFENADFTGNGVDQNTCTFAGDSITCTARGTAKSGQISKHTWKFRELALCEYEVKNEAPKSTPTPVKNPNGTPRPTRAGGTNPTETPGPNAGFDADIEADGCNANKVARLKIKWDLSSQTKDCSITIEGGGQKETRTGCTSENLIYDALPKGSSNDLKSETKYTITIKSADKVTARDTMTAKCEKGTTATNTPAAGQPNPTNPPGQINPPTNIKAECKNVNGTLKLITSWSQANAEGVDADVKIQEGEITTYSQTDIGSPFTFPDQANKQIISNLRSGKVYTVGIMLRKANQNITRSASSNACPTTTAPPASAQAQKDTTIGAKDIGQELLNFFNL